ncbi:toll/interleukin-1 receptor domain-containing protein [Lentzea alba]|uniref:toll/interleukin-1 receptor domain-containing protein n=1 Tax=Lentzea alba TaxID=2714351 RepID=UPI0039BF275A
MATQTVRIFLSWCRRDKDPAQQLVHDLRPTLRLFTDLTVEWWQDSHLTCGEEFTGSIKNRIDEADFGLLLLSSHYLDSSFVLEHELPRFVGPTADKGALPVRLKPLLSFGAGHNFQGVDALNMFALDGKAYTETRGNRRTDFANKLAEEIRRSALGDNGYRR